MDIPPEDLLIETYPPRQRGGQHCGFSGSGVQITHLPSGLIAIAKHNRSQHRNKAVALDMILAGLTTPSGR